MSFWYLASPYTNYPGGRKAAWEEVTKNAAILVNSGIPIYAPITHCWPIAQYLLEDQDNHDTWLPQDKFFVEAAKGIIVCMMKGWQQSYGVMWEIAEFEKMGKPVIYMEPGVIPNGL